MNDSGRGSTGTRTSAAHFDGFVDGRTAAAHHIRQAARSASNQEITTQLLQTVRTSAHPKEYPTDLRGHFLITFALCAHATHEQRALVVSVSNLFTSACLGAVPISLAEPLCGLTSGLSHAQLC
eukprot:5062341-Amphidinium_carterae.1